jgi:hypothetical protein
MYLRLQKPKCQIENLCQTDLAPFLCGLVQVKHEMCSQLATRIYTYRNQQTRPEAVSLVVNG